MKPDTWRILPPSVTRFVPAATALALVFAACGSPPPRSDAPASSSPPATTTQGRIAGRVVFEGAHPPSARIRLDADPQCAALAHGESRPTDDLLVGDANALQNVFVYVTQGVPSQAYAVPSEPVVLDQQQCRYVPRVLGLQVGQTLAIRNSDPLLHTVRADAAVNGRFNVGTPIQGMEVRRSFTASEVMVPVGCDMHPWMRAYIGVLNHPFFDVTGEDGRFSIDRLPPGDYVVESWHERLGTRRQEVTVPADEAADVTFRYGGF